MNRVLISKRKIEARNSSVLSGYMDVPSTEKKGEAAEESRQGRKDVFWDAAEYAVYCHRMWSAIVESDQVSGP